MFAATATLACCEASSHAASTSFVGSPSTAAIVPGAGRGKLLRQIPPHAHFLRALARAEPDDGRSMLRPYHRTTMLPQVKPAPNAQNITFMPGCTRPHFTASSSAMAMEAADVLPKRSTLT